MVELEPATATVPGDATSMAELWQARLDGHDRFAAYGRVTRVVGLVLEATGIDVGLGSLCRITSHARDRSVLAEVVGFNERHVLLMPLGELDGLHAGAIVQPLGRSFRPRRHGRVFGKQRFVLRHGPNAARQRGHDRLLTLFFHPIVLIP